MHAGAVQDCCFNPDQWVRLALLRRCLEQRRIDAVAGPSDEPPPDSREYWAYLQELNEREIPTRRTVAGSDLRSGIDTYRACAQAKRAVDTPIRPADLHSPKLGDVTPVRAETPPPDLRTAYVVSRHTAQGTLLDVMA